jgi:hypothetical protein
LSREKLQRQTSWYLYDFMSNVFVCSVLHCR